MLCCLTQNLEWVKKDSGVGKISLAAVEQDLAKQMAACELQTWRLLHFHALNLTQETLLVLSGKNQTQMLAWEVFSRWLSWHVTNSCCGVRFSVIPDSSCHRKQFVKQLGYLKYCVNWFFFLMKCLDKGNGIKELYLAQFENIVHPGIEVRSVGKGSGWSHCTVVTKMRAMSAGAQLILYFLCSLKTQPLKWCCPAVAC